MGVNKTYNGGQWTPARFHSFIKGALRAASNRWGPKYACKKSAWIRRGWYRCAGYNCEPHEVPASLPPPTKKHKRRINNALVDHIKPVVDPVQGFTSWDELISRLFCEVDGLQVLCHDCHSRKTADEQEQRKSI